MTSPETGLPDLASVTYERLRELIVFGRLAPGTRIIESDLAARLGVSRTPVRSALHRLQQEGFVIASDGGRNARLSVAPLTQADARELLDILGVLEGFAAARAAELQREERTELTAELRRINADLARLIVDDAAAPEDVFRSHTRFHQQPLERIDAPRLRALHAAIRPQAERYRRVYISSLATGIFSTELPEHDAIIEALDRGDPQAAQMAVQDNWHHAGERLAGVIAAMGERGRW